MSSLTSATAGCCCAPPVARSSSRWRRSPRSPRPTSSGRAATRAQSATTRRFGLGYALRALSRDRATVAVHLLGHEAALVGTIDGVGADHLDLAEHPEGTARRRENVTAVTTVATSALLLVESRR